jgi:putative ABC transport system permease protein
LLTISLRDLQFRKRQFAIAIIGAAMVFAMALILTGAREGFNTEARDTVEGTGADGWVVPDGVSGPFTTVSGLPEETAEEIAAQPGVEAAAPFVAATNTAELDDGELLRINVLGVVPYELGAPGDLKAGEELAGAGEAVVDKRLEGVEVGDTIAFSGKEFEVVGQVEDRSYFGGVPAVFIPLPDAQEIIYRGQPLSNAVMFTGQLADPPEGLKVQDNEEVQEDMKRVLDGAIGTIDLTRLLMWIVAAVIIGTVIYLSALERLTDFAVLKAVGGESRSLAIGLSLQAVIASVLSAAVAAVLAQVLRPFFPLPITLKPSAYLLMTAIAIVVGVLASIAALRRVLKVDPALAFG